MTNVLERLPAGARSPSSACDRVVDCVLTTPAISLLKHARSDLRIAMVVEDAFAPRFRGEPGFGFDSASEAVFGNLAVAPGALP